MSSNWALYIDDLVMKYLAISIYISKITFWKIKDQLFKKSGAWMFTLS